MSDPTSLPAEIGCECHLGDFESPECGKRAVCQIEGLFVCSGCKIRVLTKYPPHNASSGRDGLRLGRSDTGKAQERGNDEKDPPTDVERMKLSVHMLVLITRVPVVLKQGIPCAAYDMPLPERLRTVGYAALMERTNEYAVEIKRGSLARKAATRAGLDFKIATGLTREQMPDFYRSVDALILSSLQEGGAMPPYEAAAAGRLVIGTPVGDFPRLCLEGMGILGPLNDQVFEDFAVATLRRYVADETLFRMKCASIKTAARDNRDWKIVMPEWQKFIFDSYLTNT